MGEQEHVSPFSFMALGMRRSLRSVGEDDVSLLFCCRRWRWMAPVAVVVKEARRSKG